MVCCIGMLFYCMLGWLCSAGICCYWSVHLCVLFRLRMMLEYCRWWTIRSRLMMVSCFLCVSDVRICSRGMFVLLLVCDVFWLKLYCLLWVWVRYLDKWLVYRSWQWFVCFYRCYLFVWWMMDVYRHLFIFK
jgi:hypothetical protein